jgi:hypothetical protein
MTTTTKRRRRSKAKGKDGKIVETQKTAKPQKAREIHMPKQGNLC